MLHVAPTAFGPSGLFGGGERYPVELARALVATGEVDCELLTFGPRADEFEADGLRVRVLRARAHLRGHPAHPVAPALVGALRGADVVHTHHLRSLPSRVAAVVGKAARRRVVVTDHGLGGSDWLGLLPRLFDRSLAVSAYSASLLPIPPAKSRVIYGGADPDRFSPEPDGARAGVLYVGRWTPHKGIDRLVAALPDGATLTIAGSGGHDGPGEPDYVADLRAWADGRDVRFVGPIDDAALPALYRRAAVVVLPSVHVTCYGRRIAVSELLGLSVLEAMASGAPVVASRLGGLPEVVVDGETGYLVEPGDTAGLRRRLEELLADPARAAAMGARGRARVLERFTWEACARRCIANYRELVSA